MAHKNIVVLISGKQGCGKTTLATALANWALNDKVFWVYVLKFADALYEIHNAIFSILEAQGEPRPTKTDGTLLQLLGTEWGRKTLGQDIWVRILKRKVAKVVEFVKWPKHKLIIIDDARFANEIDCFKGDEKLTVIKLRLECNEGMRKARAEKWRDNVGHASETGLDNYNGFDNIIYTDTHNVSDTFELAKKLIEAKL